MERRIELTHEDLDIWVCVGYRFPELPVYTPGWLRLQAGEQDRKDADLMLTFVQLGGAWPYQTRHTMLGTIGISFEEISSWSVGLYYI